MTKAVIIGAGLMGSAMAWPLSDNGHEVCLVGTHLDDEIIDRCRSKKPHPRLNRKLPDAVTPFFFHDVDRALEGADLIVSGVSSPGVDWIAKLLADRVRAGQQVVSITKGLRIDDAGKVRLFPDIIAESFPIRAQNSVIPVAVGGTMHRRRTGGETTDLRDVRQQECRSRGDMRPPVVHELLPSPDNRGCLERRTRRRHEKRLHGSGGNSLWNAYTRRGGRRHAQHGGGAFRSRMSRDRRVAALDGRRRTDVLGLARGRGSLCDKRRWKDNGIGEDARRRENLCPGRGGPQGGHAGIRPDHTGDGQSPLRLGIRENHRT